jgi:hypothetical protein
MQSAGASEDNILRVTISHYAEGLQGTEAVLRSLRYIYMAPFIIVALGALVAFSLIGERQPAL